MVRPRCRALGPEFTSRYQHELEGHGKQKMVDTLLDIKRHQGTLTLLFAARAEVQQDEAEVLAGTCCAGGLGTPTT